MKKIYTKPCAIVVSVESENILAASLILESGGEGIPGDNAQARELEDFLEWDELDEI